MRLSLMADAAGAAATAAAVGILTDSKLTMTCVIGSIMGAFLAIAVLPMPSDEKDRVRLIAVRYFASLFVGIVFSPGMIRFANAHGWAWIDGSIETVLLVSGVVSLIGVSAIQTLAPIFTGWLHKKAKKASE